MFVDNQPYAEDDGLWKHYKEHMEMRNSVLASQSKHPRIRGIGEMM
jgi:hypothetical protein